MNKTLSVIFLTIFIDLLGFGILIPVIPLLLADPLSTYYLLPKNVSIETGYIILGYLTAVFPIGQFLAAPILGQLSDKYGRKKVLALCLSGTCLSYVLFAIGIMTKNIPLLFISRFFDGVTGGNISVAQAAIADISTPQNRAKNFGLISAAFGLGFILGPFIGGKLSDPTVISWFDATTPFWFAAIISLINVLSVLFIFPETRNHISKAKIKWSKSITNILHAAAMPNVKNLFIVSFLFQGGFAFFTTFFSIFLIKRLGFTQGNIGDFFAFVGLWITITQAFTIRKVTKIATETQILRITLFTTGIGILTYFLPSVWWQLYLIAPFLATSNGLSFPSLAALISKSVGPEVQGEVLGINASVQALSLAIPAVLSGYIAASLSIEAPIVVSTLTILLAWFVFITTVKGSARK